MSEQTGPGYALALDVGGTFTDVILADRSSGAYWVTKSPSVPADPSQGFFDGVDKVLAIAGVPAGKVSLALHGSTVATNAILENKGARTALVVTAGFRHVLEIGRADIPRKENLFGWVKPKRPVLPRDIYEVPERVLIDGTVMTPLNTAQLEEVCLAVRGGGYAAVAVVLLHSYAHPAHECAIGDALRRLAPDLDVSLSHEVLPLFREFERTLATVLNASVQPLAGRYVGRLETGLAKRGIKAPFFIMKSNGGVYPPSAAQKQPVHLALSGPAAGARGAALIGQLSGCRDLITIDMGGTSADVALIRNGEPEVSTSGRVGEFPLALPIIDIHTIGAGGGSIAHVTAEGALRVGPESAGAAPGPAAYGRGGTRATVSDANLVLGRIPPHLLDGEVPLDHERAAAAIRTHVAEPLGLSLEQAAAGILDIVDNTMIGALKVMSVERGLSPADFALCPFGGAGPVHGAKLMRLLGARRCVVPRYPGILCAIGLLATDLRYDFAVTAIQRAPDIDVPRVAALYADIERKADAQLAQDQVPPDRRRIMRLADIRYAGQGEELAVPLPPGEISIGLLEALIAAFHDQHQRLYTFADRKAPVEIINLRVAAVGEMDKVEMRRIDTVTAGTRAASAGTRRAALDGHRMADVPTWRREALRAGHVINGPGIVDQLDSTTLILAEQRGTVDAYGNLIIEEVR
jgi:N-methylhydantoinase A